MYIPDLGLNPDNSDQVTRLTTGEDAMQFLKKYFLTIYKFWQRFYLHLEPLSLSDSTKDLQYLHLLRYYWSEVWQITLKTQIELPMEMNVV